MERLPIEPLDKSKWDRIERALQEHLDEDPVPAAASPRGWRPIAAIAAVAAAIAITLVAREATRPQPKEVAAASATTHIETGDVPSHVAVGGSSLDVAPRSAAHIEGTDETGVVVTLDHGGVDCEVAPRNGRPPFLVHAGDVTVRVIGTHFRVERDGDQTRVSVQHGAVEVALHGVTSLVRAGTTWPAPPEAPSTASAAAPASATVPSIHTAAPSAPTPSPSARDRYDNAAALEATHPDEALAIYRDLAQGDGAWAMNALYAEGRFELERGNKSNARSLFAEYLRRFPTGPNASDARDLYAKLQ